MANGTTANTPGKRNPTNRRNGQKQEPKQVPFISAYDLSRDLCGSIDSGVCDLTSNKKHLKGLCTVTVQCRTEYRHGATILRICRDDQGKETIALQVFLPETFPCLLHINI